MDLDMGYPHGRYLIDRVAVGASEMIDNGYERAAAEYDAKEPPSGDWPRCKCGEKYADHYVVIREPDDHIFRICPDAYANLFEEHVYEEEPEPEEDPDRRRDEREDR